MRPDEIPIALSKFGQLDGAHARASDGAGLGLPLSVNLMALHGGQLVIESTPGQGTTVRAIFPAERLWDEPATASGHR